jgi:CBS domain-containing protein/beta-phosphoglucomutase-like phosphatase (HAD superfamily)
MNLKGIILRADGVVAETDGLERSVLNRVVQAAGFDWKCSREGFKALRQHQRRRDRYRQFVRQNLGFDRSSEDFERLIDVMTRHSATVARELIDKDYIDPRPGARELASAARQEGIKIGVVTALPKPEVEHLMTHLFGEGSKRLFACVTAPESEDGEESLLQSYQKVVEKLDLDPQSCIALEGTPHGARTARTAGIPAVILLGHHDAGASEDALFAVDELPALIGLDDQRENTIITPGDGAEILAALRRAHAGYFDLFGGLHRSYAMKVSDILKDKGSAVKAVKATDSILTLAQKMKSDAVGAMVVIGPSGRLEGIISERDIANGLATHGDGLTRMLVGDLMTRAVVTCSPEDPIANVAKMMTQRRFRHMPVQQDGELIGVVSIGDVLKHRLDELQLETNVLRDFVIARG